MPIDRGWVSPAPPTFEPCRTWWTKPGRPQYACCRPRGHRGSHRDARAPGVLGRLWSRLRRDGNPTFAPYYGKTTQLYGADAR